MSKTKETIVIFGGTGFIGKDITQKLLKQGHKIKIFSKNPDEAGELKTNASLGQLESHYIDITNEESIKGAITGADSVLNLIGIKSGSKKDFFLTHVMFPKLLAKSIKTLKIKKLIHFSSIGVDKIYDSGYAHSKYEGDQCIHIEARHSVVVRPSLVFGQGDHFIHKLYYISLNYLLLPVASSSAETKPVFLGDVSKSILEILENYDSYKGKVIDIVGEKSYSMKSIIELIQSSIGKKINFLPLPNPIYRGYVLLSRLLPDHVMSKENTHLLRCSHKSSRNIFEENSNQLTTLESFLSSLSHSEEA